MSAAVITITQTLLAGVVYGQLTDEDIAALEAEGAARGWTFTVGRNSATELPLDQLCGLEEPDNWREGARFDPCKPRLGLPTSYDWRELGGCTPIKDQGNCGSCWAFSTVAPLECGVKIKDGLTVDLSEQWLVSCNSDGWGCGGGWFAHDYHQWKTDPCGGTGAVLESSFPYVASDVPCNCPYGHEYLIDSWAFVGTSVGVPSTNSIKQAIMDYGPVSVAVYVDGAFHAYSSGVFNACQNGPCNHAVALVGWDDNQGAAGVWFLRNSWGTGWGESGYMRIQYGCSNVGYAACYVDYPGRDDLVVTPKNDFVSRGEVGGPFVPGCRTYTLTNRGTSPLNWTATWNESWIEATPSGGSLTGGASTSVDLCIRPEANTLPMGTYSDVVTFTNTTSGSNRTRRATLRVGQPDYFTEQFTGGDNDLDNQSLTLTPDGSRSFYSACSEPITDLPTDPAGGTTLALSDDSYAALTLSGAAVSLYGASRSTFYVGSNGYITFSSGDSCMVESLADHFDLPRISGLFDDLNPQSGGTVSWKQLPDRAVVTWEEVPEYGYSNSNTFQIEMYFDGTIRVAWLGIAAADGLAGLSGGGGLPEGFFESDLSEYGPCLPPAPPGDFDRDDDVDLEDFGHLQACFTGPGVPSVAPDCYNARLDGDSDIDQADFGIFQLCMTGANIPADLHCAD